MVSHLIIMTFENGRFCCSLSFHFSLQISSSSLTRGVRVLLQIVYLFILKGKTNVNKLKSLEPWHEKIH